MFAKKLKFIPEEKISKIHILSLAFCGLILAFRQGTEPRFGRIIHGNNFRNSKVQFNRLLIKAERILREIRTLTKVGESPPLHLNVHCFVCEFRERCHTIAVEKDHLSLLRGMKRKELSKLNNKGTFTVTQLSYTFRPRKKSKRTNPKSVKHHHSLKALAIREKRIYVIGSPDLNMTGTPVYLDVEGIPDQDFYYLIGLKVGSVDSCFQRSFWADSSVDEEKIWRECTQTLVTIDNPQLFHYGSYETTFLNRMRTRYPPKADEVAIVDKLIEGAQNVLSVIYGHIYFPTYSNSLKDIASFLGYAWSMDDPSGHKSLLLRHRWELCHSTSIRQDLITYNAEDCEALEVVVKTVLRLIPKEDTSATLEHPDAVHADTLKPEYSYNLGPVEFILPEFNYINKCSYWDYQRDRIYIRSNPLLRQVARKKQRKRGSSLPVNKTVVASWPWKCPKCDARKIYKKSEHTKLLYDMRFSDGGVKR
ncbi:MAG: TM0106 family RecB-like putative nuclease, partial [Candidatus Dojkabacteria bacterium]